VEEMVRDVAVELRRRKNQGTEEEAQDSDGGRGLTMAELIVGALKVCLSKVVGRTFLFFWESPANVELIIANMAILAGHPLRYLWTPCFY